MLYSIKVVKATGERRIRSCGSYSVKIVPPESPAALADPPLAEPGVYVELHPSGVEIVLPRDGTDIWITNAAGTTEDHLAWPLPRKQATSKKEATV